MNLKSPFFLKKNVTKMMFSILFSLFVLGCSKDSVATKDKEASSKSEEKSKPDEQETAQEGDKIVSIHFPDKFIYEATKFNVLLSDTSGNVLGTSTYSNQEKTVDFYTTEPFDDDTPFTLTFIEEYSASSRFYIYPNLSRNILDGDIEFKPRGFSLEKEGIRFSTENFEFPIMNAAGNGYSMFNYLSKNEFQGTYTMKFNENLGSDNIFIKYYDPNETLNEGYRWVLFDTKEELSSLSISDFNSNNVNYYNFNTNRPAELPLLTMYGYENEFLMSHMSGHEIYSSQVPAFGYGGNHYYAKPDFFEETSFSISFLNYTLFGLGIPPNTIEVPDKSVSATFSNRKIAYKGLEDFEVGRVSLDVYSLNLKIEVIFDGRSTEISLPNMPDGLISDPIKKSFNDGENLRFVQAIAENYSGFQNYDEYVQNVLKVSEPFYLNSPTRERVFFSHLATQVQLIPEFPNYQSFR